MAATSIILSLSGNGALFLLLLLLPLGCWGDADPQLAYEEGYFKREHSLVQPYQGQGMELPFWDFTGSTVVTNQYVRLTPDRQSKQGTIWNRVVGFYTAHTIYIIIIMIMAHLATLYMHIFLQPIMVHDWEILLHFAVHGSGKDLFGDGFALWYTKERNEIGTYVERDKLASYSVV